MDTVNWCPLMRYQNKGLFYYRIRGHQFLRCRWTFKTVSLLKLKLHYFDLLWICCSLQAVRLAACCTTCCKPRFIVQQVQNQQVEVMEFGSRLIYKRSADIVTSAHQSHHAPWVRGTAVLAILAFTFTMTNLGYDMNWNMDEWNVRSPAD